MISRFTVRRPQASDADYLAFCIVDHSDGPPSWVRCGQGRLNSDGSLNIRLDALPITGELHLRPVPRDASLALAPLPEAAPDAPAVQPLHS